MAKGKDYYDVLGVPRTASTDEIRGAWRTLVRQYHPDVSDEPDAEDRFNEVQEAYDVLSDEVVDRKGLRWCLPVPKLPEKRRVVRDVTVDGAGRPSRRRPGRRGA